MKTSAITYTIRPVIILLVALPLNLYAQESSSYSMKEWEELLDKPQLADFFNGIFDNLGIIVDETSEEFTVHHKGNHFTLSKGINKASVDYTVHLKPENIANMKRHGSDEEISSDEAYKIMSVLFSPLTKASLDHPMLKKPLKRKLAGIENLIHVNLISNNNKNITSHSLIFINREWIVAEGIHGTPKRTYSITPEQALDYQRHIFKAIKNDTRKEWNRFRKWYLTWRKNVSTKV